MSLSRGAIVSLGSSILQLAVTIVTVPIYLRVIGLERYGVIVVVWLLFDYFTLFNAGLDRAVGNMVARHKHEAADAGAIFWSASLIALALGIVGGLILLFGLYPLMQSAMGVSTALTGEAGASIFWVAFCLPIFVLGTILSAFLQAHERFSELSAAQLAMSVVFQVLPLGAALAFGPSLQTVLIAGAVARATLPVSLAFFAWRQRHRTPRSLSKAWSAKLLRYGLWTSVTSIVSPMIFNLDRLAISGMLGPVAVSPYTLPYNLVMRLQLLPGTLANVIFPRMSAHDDAARQALAEDSTVTLAVMLIPFLIGGAFLIRPFLYLWIGPALATEAGAVGQWLLIGVWFNGLAIVPYIALQAKARPDVIAKLHVAEIVPFVAFLFYALSTFGLIGAAVTWTLRAVVDSLVLFYAAGLLGVLMRRLLFPLLVLTVSVAIGLLVPMELWEEIGLAAIGNLLILVWIYLREPESLRRLLRLIPFSGRLQAVLLPGG